MICRSGLMTTADIVDNSGHCIQDEQLDTTNAYKMGVIRAHQRV